MMRSMFAAVSGLRVHQAKMDVIGNNIANVNTVGFKESRVTFQDMLSDTIRSSSASQGGRGGTNPFQVGMGVALGSIDTIHKPGNPQDTGRATDLAIRGDGFFVVSDGKKDYYTRAAVFGVDDNGNFINSNGFNVKGWMARNGAINTASVPMDITISSTQILPPAATESIWFASNLDARANGELLYIPSPLTITDTSNNSAKVSIILTKTANFNEWKWEAQVAGGTINGDNSGIIELDSNGKVKNSTVSGFEVVPNGGDPVLITAPAVDDAGGGAFNVATGGVISASFTPAPDVFTSTTVYDSLGNPHDVFVTFKKVEANRWSWEARLPSGDIIGGGESFFSPSGELLYSSGGSMTFNPAGAQAISIEPRFSGLTQYGEESGIITSQDGYEAGIFEGFTIDSRGVLTGSYSNGLSQPIAQLAMVRFTNPAGLMKSGESLFEVSSNSGDPQIGIAGTGGRGNIIAGALEMSNVDIAKEFTEMIITQRGLQANSRVITTSDEIFQELVNLKR